MKPGDIFKGIFGLAVRLLGLVFLYYGLSAVPPLLDLGALETAAKSDIIAAILPIVFNLAVAWWLIGGGMLIRRAYSETASMSVHFPAHGATPITQTVQPQEKTGLEAADQKLAPLVEAPKSDRAP
jgi:hypothetical protein